MDSLEYNRRALLTESKPTELNFGEIGLHILMNASINMGEIMNIAKRTMFYGKAFDAEKVRQLAEMQAGYAQLIFELSDKLAEKNDKGNYNALPEEAHGIDPKNLNLRLLHCAFGINTESAELLEAMRDQLEGKPFDKVNFAEELGDVDWYKQVGHAETGVPESETRAKNVAKLELRNKGQTFNAEATINRDHAAERAILEGQVGTQG